MNAKELARAQKLLRPHADRFETMSKMGGGSVLTVHWIDGGQRLFWTFSEVEAFLESKAEAAGANAHYTEKDNA